MRNRPYQRRRRIPVIAVVTVLLIAAAATWSAVLIKADATTGAAACPRATSGPPPGDVLAAGALTNVAPAAPATVKVRVLNAGGQRGQANLVAAQFSDFGFVQSAPPTNDTFYPDGDMACKGQIRFGQAGQGAASTVALLVPCAELVRDRRADATVDVAVGTTFGDLNPGRAVRDTLEQLGASGSGSDGAGNADPSANNPAPATTPVVDAGTLKAAREAGCN